MRKWMKLTPQIVTVFALLSSQVAGAISFAEVYEWEWGDTVGGSGSEYLYDVTKSSDGYAAAGISYSMDSPQWTGIGGSGDALIVKYSKDGTLAWAHAAGGTDTDRYTSVTTVSDGYVATGWSSSTDAAEWGNAGSSDAVLVKYNFDGTIAWGKSIGGTSSDQAFSIDVASDGLIVGLQSSSTDSPDWINDGSQCYIVKYDFNGNAMWSVGTSTLNLRQVIALSDGYLVVGDAYNPSLLWGNNGMYDAVIIKYDLAGNLVWAENAGGAGFDEYKNAIEVSDGYIVSGNSDDANAPYWGFNGGWDDAIIVKYDKSGNIVWGQNAGGTGAEQYRALTAVSDGVIAVGWSDSTDAPEWGTDGVGDAVIAKYGFDGTFIWAETFGWDYWEYDDFFGVLADGDRLVVVGESGTDTQWWGDASVFDADNGIIVVFSLLSDTTSPGTPDSGSVFERFGGVSMSFVAFAIGALVVSALGATWCYINRSK